MIGFKMYINPLSKYNRFMKKPYIFILLISAVVFVSGCAQATTVLDAVNKMKALGAAGYYSDYTTNFKIEGNDKLKSATIENPSSLGSLGSITALPTLSFKISEAKKGNKEKGVVDLSTLADALSTVLTRGQPSNFTFPLKSLSIYMDKETNKTAICLEVSENNQNQIVCNKGKLDTISKLSPALSSQLSSVEKVSQQGPENLLEQFKKLYDKGALKLGPQSKKTVIGRECDLISYTVSDLSKLETKEMIALLGPVGSQLLGLGQIQESQLDQISFIFKQLIKEVKQELCLDVQHGLPLSTFVSTEIDLSAASNMASSLGLPAQPGAAKIPEGVGLIFRLSTEVTNFKTPIEDTEFDLPQNAIVQDLDAQAAASTQA